MEGGSSWQQGDLACILDREHPGLYQVHHVEPQLQDQGKVSPSSRNMLMIILCIYVSSVVFYWKQISCCFQYSINFLCRGRKTGRNMRLRDGWRSVWIAFARSIGRTGSQRKWGSGRELWRCISSTRWGKMECCVWENKELGVNTNSKHMHIFDFSLLVQCPFKKNGKGQ